MNGVMLAVVASIGHVALELVDLDVRGAQQRAVERLEAPQRRSRRAARNRIAPRGLGVAQLRVELHVAGLEHPRERARRERLAHGLHLGELPALAEDGDERRRLRVDLPELPELEEDDGPGNDGKSKQGRQHDMADQRLTRNESEQVAETFRRLARHGRLKEGKGIVSKDTHLGSSVNSDNGAPLGRR